MFIPVEKSAPMSAVDKENGKNDSKVTFNNEHINSVHRPLHLDMIG